MVAASSGVSVETARLLREQAWFGKDAAIGRSVAEALTVVACWSNGLCSLPVITWKSGAQPLVCAATEGLRSEHRAGCGCVDRPPASCLLRRCLRSRALHLRRAMSSPCPRNWPRFFASPAQKPTCTLAQRFPFATSGLGWFIRLPWLFIGNLEATKHLLARRWAIAPSGPERCMARWLRDFFCSRPSRHRDLGHAVRFGEFASRTGTLYRDICSRMSWSGGPDQAYAVVGQVLSCLVCPPSTPLPLHLFQRVYVSLLAGCSPPSTIQTMAALRCADPLKSWTSAADPELHLTTRLLHYLREEGRSDEDLALVFWQYQRIRSLTYRHLVQAPGVPGLDWFTRIYGRITSLAKAIDATSVTCALELESQDVNLGALQRRMGPKAKEGQVIARLRSVAKQSSGFSSPRKSACRGWGALAFHQGKIGEGPRPCLTLSCRPSGQRSSRRDMVAGLIQRSNAQAIVSALDRCPSWPLCCGALMPRA